MALTTFPLFTNFHFDIRSLIYQYATTPRLVHIQAHHETIEPGSRPTIIPWRGEVDYLYSTSPVPPLLHTCKESREALRRSGYVLAFQILSADRRFTSEARTWFNFNHDVLFSTLSDPDEYVKFCTDLHRVKRIALTNVLNWDYLLEDTWVTGIDCLEELFFVEELHEEGLYVSWNNNHWDRIEDPLGFIDCDVADIWCSIGSDRQDLLYRYGREVWKLWRATGKHRRDFFQDLAKEFEEKLRKRRKDWFIGPFVSVCDNCVVKVSPQRKRLVPKVRHVSLVKRSGAEKRWRSREAYWKKVQEREDWEAVFGHPLLHAETDTFFQGVADDDEVMKEREQKRLYNPYPPDPSSSPFF